MIVIDIRGGDTDQLLNLTFYSDKYKAISKYDKDNNLVIQIEKHKFNKKSKILGLPFVRGLYVYLFNNVTESEGKNKLTFNAVDIIAVVIYILDKIYFKISLMDYVYILFTCLYFIVAITSKRMTQLHGAEHILANYYNQYHKVNLNDIDKIKESSIIHIRCGSNFYGIKLVILLLLKIFINDFMIRFFIMQSLNHEITSLRKRKIVYYITYPLYAFGMLTQRLFFVRQPSDKDLEQAIKTVQELEKYENEKL